MALHPQTAAFVAAYNANAPAIDYDTVTAAELSSLFSIPTPEIVSAGLRGVEAPFPAGLDDCWAVLQWLAEHGGEIGGDPSRIAVAGNSSGGNFAAVLAQRAAREGLTLRHQLLVFPVTDARMDHNSHRLFGEGYFLTTAMMRVVLAALSYLRR